jgi:hypothetical protein
MVSKKKVSKRVVISGKENAKKSRGKSINNKSPSIPINPEPINNKPAAVLLNIAAPTQNQVSIPSANVTKIESITSTANPSPEQVIDTNNNVDNKLNSIFADDKAQPKPEVQSHLLTMAVLIFFSVIILFWLTVVVLSIDVHSGPHSELRNVSVIRKVPINLSFEDMNITQNGSQEISIQGMLRKETVQPSKNSSSTTNYIVDDTGRKIAVRIKLSQMNDYDKLFTNNTKIKTAYNVTGTYRYSADFNGYIIDPVSSIQPYARELSEVSEWSIQNFTIQDTKGIKFDISKGWGKVNSLI